MVNIVYGSDNDIKNTRLIFVYTLDALLDSYPVKSIGDNESLSLVVDSES